MKNRRDYFEIINSFPHTIGIYFTFTLDKAVIDKIAEETDANIVIIHDSRYGVSLKNNYEGRVCCIPALPNNPTIINCFHSKLAFLKGEENAKLLVGSANLSKASFASVKEICIEIDLDFNSNLYLEILKYIKQIKTNTVTETEVLNNLLEKCTYDLKPINNKDLTFISNTFEKSISSTLLEHIKEDEQPILKIAAPFLAKDFSDELENFLNKINPSEIQLYLRNNYPVPEALKKHVNLKIYQPKKGGNRELFHAKVYSIKYSSNEVILLGSPNFSKQAFFQSLIEGGNHECGVVITSSGAVYEWFNKGWENPIYIEDYEYKEDESLSAESEVFAFKQEIYSWAERKKESVAVFIFIPYEYKERQIKVDGKKQEKTLVNSNSNLYKCEIITSKTTVKIEVGTIYNEEIVLFDEEIFEKRINEKESLFYFSKGIRSMNSREVEETIRKKGIKLNLGDKYIIEPPVLEQYFKNVKEHLQIIGKKQFYSKFQMEEIRDLLIVQTGGEGIYTCSLLYNLFIKKNLNEIAQKSFERIEQLLVEIPEITPQEYNKFLHEYA